MPQQASPYIVPLLLSALISAVFTTLLVSRRSAPGAAALLGVMAGVAEWSLCSAMQWASASFAGQFFWLRLRFLGTEVISVGFLIFALQYVGKLKKPQTLRMLALLSIIPLVSLAALWTNEFHELFFRNLRLVLNDYAALRFEFGPWFWVHTLYDYLLLGGGLLFFAQAFMQTPGLYRAQIGAVVVAAVTPLAANFVSITGLSPFPDLDLTPFAFTLTGITLAAGFYRYRMFDVTPVTRDAVMQSIGDAVLVLDAQNRVLDLNAAAEQALGLAASQVIGRPAREALAAWPQLAEFYGGGTTLTAPLEIMLGEGADRRYFDVRTSVAERDGQITSRLVLLHDITDRKQAEETLRQSESQYRSIIASLEDPYFEADLEGNLTLVNAAFVRGIGYNRVEEVQGRHFRHFTDRKYIRTAYEIFNTVYRTGQPYKGVEFWLQLKDSTISQAETSITLIRDEAGNPVGFRGIGRDITDRKRAEEALQKAKQAAEHELEIGRQIQAGFLPEALPTAPGWEIAAGFHPARQVAGDFYDAFQLGHSQKICLVVADVCDKGVGAALFMGLFRSLIRAYATQLYSLSWKALLDDGGADGTQTDWGIVSDRTALLNIVNLTNNYIAIHHSRANMFATLFVGVLNPETGLLLYVNGGHEAPALVGGAGMKARLNPTGPAVGMLPDLEFQTGQAQFEPGDVLVAFTDGVTEARGRDKRFFTEDRLLALLKPPIASATTLLDKIEKQLRAHTEGMEQSDDITLLAVRRAERESED